jgi:hypothetical protein
MKSLDISQTLQVLSNVGVIVGIVFLAMELRQNQVSLDEANALNRAVTMSEATANFGRFRSMLAENEDLARLWLRANAGESLSDIDALRFQQLCQEVMFDQAAVYQRSIVLGDTAAAQGTVEGIRPQIRRPNWRECWSGGPGSVSEVMRRNGYGDFVQRVNSE